MGQYYRPIFLTENNKPLFSVTCYDFGSGAKLMEHSWIKVYFVRFVEKQLMIQPQKLVWAGDYADNEETEGVNLYTLSENVGKLTHDETIPKNKSKYDYDFKNIAPLTAKYLINYDKKEFVNKSKTPKDSDGWKMHPLPLLTCEGNGRGGGDFRGDGKDLVGRWSRDKIGVSTRKSDIPKDFKEVVFDLTE